VRRDRQRKLCGTQRICKRSDQVKISVVMCCDDSQYYLGPVGSVGVSGWCREGIANENSVRICKRSDQVKISVVMCCDDGQYYLGPVGSVGVSRWCREGLRSGQHLLTVGVLTL